MPASPPGPAMTAEGSAQGNNALHICMNTVLMVKDVERELIWDAQRTGENKHCSPWRLYGSPRDLKL